MKEFEHIYNAYMTSCASNGLKNQIRKKEMQRAFYSGALAVFSLMDEIANRAEDEAEVATVVNDIQAVREEILSTLGAIAEEGEPLNTS